MFARFRCFTQACLLWRLRVHAFFNVVLDPAILMAAARTQATIRWSLLTAVSRSDSHSFLKRWWDRTGCKVRCKLSPVTPRADRHVSGLACGSGF